MEYEDGDKEDILLEELFCLWLNSGETFSNGMWEDSSGSNKNNRPGSG